MKNEKFKNRNFPVLCSVLFAFSFLTVAKISPLMAQAKRPMELEDMFRVKRVSDPQLSPDGKWVAFVIAEVDKPNNKTNSDIWLIPSGGGEAKQLTSSPKHDRHPRWSPDGKWIAFESNRDGSYQIYLVSSSGGDAKQLTSISTDANQAVWSPDGKNIAFVSAVFPEFSDKPYKESDALNKKKQDARDNSNVKGRIMTKLLYRHWDSWVDDKRQHIFVVPIDGSADPRDVTPGDRDAIPTSSTFSAGDDFDFSPDGNELVYTATPIPPHEEAWSTNHDIFTVNLITGDRKQITTNLAADGFPRYSPDGKYIAYRAQSRRNFEADRWQLMLYDRAIGKTRSLTESFDSNIDAIQWTRDSKKVFFDAEEKANKPIWTVSIKGNDVKKTVDNAVNGDVTISSDGAMLVFSHASFMRPIEIYTASSDGKNLNQLTHVNDQLFSQISFTTPEYVWFTGANNTKVQMWVIKPPMFDEKKKYPFVFWVHGGPQGAFLNSWSYRWNPEVWASQGYVLALPNPRGSTGFGQKFTDEISHDWGGKVFDDLMNGLAYMEKLPYIDTTSMAAAGASYGGYMMNWFQGHTNQFKTLVTHDGVFNFASMYGTTEEVWFDEWEHGIPWENPDFDKFSPHKYAANFKTPNLIIHNELDYRVPLTEGQQLFTTLQRKGIPSKLLYFPDEGHWVLKPANSELWHKTIFEWLSEYLKPEGPHKNGSQ
ncbi:MAG: S9 family peptidase [Ignavibacteriales bacterium]|nr:S9 family peptidase [Ignavibacteriales bacterium]